MKREKKQLLAQFISSNWGWSILLAFVLWCGFKAYCDRKECVCSALTIENQTLKIDDRLESVCSIDELSPGTFSIVLLQCEHEYRLWLKIDKDAGTYQGRILN